MATDIDPLEKILAKLDEISSRLDRIEEVFDEPEPTPGYRAIALVVDNTESELDRVAPRARPSNHLAAVTGDGPGQERRVDAEQFAAARD